MAFTDFLKATVFLSAAMATVLAVVCVAGFNQDGDISPVLGLAGWWAVAAAAGFWIGRRTEPNPGIARLLANARSQTTLPEVHPGRVLLNRLWPLLLLTIAAGALAFAFPQVPGIFAGGAILWTLHWRRQESAVTAIEGRDGVRFFVEATKLWQPIQLVRTPGFKTSAFEGNPPEAVTPRG
jgi:hypothetical protein